MKIAVTSLITRKIAPVTFGGTEAFTSDLVEGLVKRGHNVTLYAASDSQTNAKVIGVVNSQTAQKEAFGEKLSFPYYLLLARKLAFESEKYDLIHNNFFNTYLFSVFAPFIKKPIIHTIHNAYFSNRDWSKVIKKFGLGKNEHFVFVSKNAQKLAGNIPNAHVIYNGIDIQKFLFSPTTSDYFLWLGRMVPEKGAHEAVKMASASGCKLVLDTIILTQAQREYYENFIKPFMGKNILFREKITFEEKIKLYQNARAFLFPIQWEEPFGLVMIESMACGTPVIAFARGSVPEVIEDGKTGFIVNRSNEDVRGDWIIKKTGIEGLSEAVERIYSMDNADYLTMREEARQHVENNFGLTRMVEEYEKLYKMLAGNTAAKF